MALLTGTHMHPYSPRCATLVRHTLVSAPPFTQMTEKTVEEVGKWVAEELKLPEYTAAFTDNHIDGAHLTVLDKEDLEDMGIKSVGHRLKILQSIKSIKQVSAIADRNKVILRFTEHCEYD